MRRSGISNAVHDCMVEYLGREDVKEDASFEQLGLDRHDIEEMMFRLQDQYGLTASTAQEDTLLKTVSRPNELAAFLQQLAKH